jgi:A/G-specific adenine glycosylase
MPSRSLREQISSVQRALLTWYETHQRNLPWRRTEDPYAIWIAEVMLQQTQVKTVAPYYQRFLERFPNVEALAQASLDDVLKVWEGLGYYARARNLHRAAQHIMEHYGGTLPKSYKNLLALPGIGTYTAGAVASIAFDRDEPVLDGNVTRVLCRTFLLRGDPKKSATKKTLRRLAKGLTPPGKAGLFNQALMDLGATICTPRKPQCERCPLKASCLAYREGQQNDLPVRGVRKRLPHYDIAMGLVWNRSRREAGARLLIAKRREEDMLGGLWEFPGGHRDAGETLEETLKRELQEELRIEVTVQEPFITVQHAFTHFRVTLHTFHCLHQGGRPRAIGCTEWRWVRPDELHQYAFPSGDRKIIDALLEENLQSNPSAQ